MSTKDQLKYTNKLLNARVLVIGGSSGIGFAVAEASLEHSAHVVISSSNPSRINSAISKIQSAYPSLAPNIHGLTVDLSNPSTLEQQLSSLLQRATQTLGGSLDHIVFTAADALAPMKLAEMTADRITRAGTLRFLAPLLLAKYIPAHITPSFRSSYTITSGSISEKPVREWTVIAAYAGGHHAMVRNLALELRPVRVNGVSPGVVDTELWRLGGGEREAFLEGCRGRLLTGRVPGAEDVAESFLAVMRDWNMDGGIVRTDGGGLIV